MSPERKFLRSLRRHRLCTDELNAVTSGNSIEPGGFLTVGGTNASLFQGAINYIPIVDNGKKIFF